MDMENILHLYLCKLRIISKVPIGGKLDISQNDLNIYYGGIVAWMFRKAYGDNKDNATKYLIELYKEINSFSDQMMYNINMEKNSIVIRKKINMLVSLTEKLKESLIGIRNLIGTYKYYLKIVSLLECLEQDVIIPQYKSLIKFIPKEFYTEILKKPIIYEYTHTSNNMIHDQIKKPSFNNDSFHPKSLSNKETFHSPSSENNSLHSETDTEIENSANIISQFATSDPIDIPELFNKVK